MPPPGSGWKLRSGSTDIYDRDGETWGPWSESNAAPPPPQQEQQQQAARKPPPKAAPPPIAAPTPAAAPPPLPVAQPMQALGAAAQGFQEAGNGELNPMLGQRLNPNTLIALAQMAGRNY